MALHFDYTTVPGPKTFEYDGQTTMHPTLHTLIISSMVVGLGEITEKNLPEWRFRLATYERLCGSLRTVAGADAPFTKQDVADYVGLKVNVTDTTRAAFMKNMTRILSENVVRSLLKEDGDA
jgi:hypothetical protein